MLSPGDTVRLIDAQGQGVVKKVRGTSVTVEIDGIDITLNEQELVKVEYDSLLQMPFTPGNERAMDKLRETEARQRLQKMQPTQQAVYELDLHIHELLDRYEHLTNTQILEYQMAQCRQFMNEARQKRYRKIILIHGVGEGVLRSEIHRWLDQLTGIEYCDAPYRTYGYGATEVTLHG